MRKDWEVKKLGDIIKLEYGKPLPDHKRVIDGIYPIYGANGIKGRTNEFYVEEATIIIGRKGSAGEINFTEPKFWPLDVTYFVTFDKKKVNLSFLNYLLSILELTKLAKGVKPGINRNEVYDLDVPFPPLKEQKRIVSILEEAFAAIDKAKVNAEKNLENARELIEMASQALFNDLSDEANVPIASVCKQIFAGGDAPQGNFSLLPTEKYKYPVIANAIKDNGLYGYTDFSIVNEPSITIAARGSGTGHIEIRKESFVPIVRLLVLVPNIDRVTLGYLKYAMKNLKILSNGSAIPQLTVPMIKGYSIALPTLTVQQSVVKKLNLLSRQCVEAKTIYEKKLICLQELKKSILQKAFAGELT